MKIAGLIPFKSFTDQAMASLYFLRILINLCFFSYVKLAAIITGCALSAPNMHISNVWVIPSELTLQNSFILLVPSIHCCLVFPHSFHSD